MKCALLALAGCNSWFGIDPTTERIPDAIDAAPPSTAVSVVYRAAQTDADKGLFKDYPITGATIRANGAPVAYDGANATVPLSVFAGTWSLEIAAPDQTTIELQSTKPNIPAVCIPRWGRLDRPPLTGDDNHIYMAVTPKKPANAIAFDYRSVLTSGVWAQRELSSKMDAVDLRWDPTIVTPLDGPLSPIGDPGDWMAVVDYQKVAGDPAARESVEFARTAAVLNASQPVNLDKTDTQEGGKVQLANLFALGLFTKAELQGTSSSYYAAVGLTASADMANQPLAGGPTKMWTLANYSMDMGGDTVFKAVVTDFLLPHVTHLRRVSTTTYNGVNLDSAVERVDVGTNTAYATGTSNMVDAAIAKATMVNDLVTSGVASVTATAPGSDSLVQWTQSDGSVDLAVVTMYEVTSVLVPVKQYVTTETSVVVAKELMKVGHDYVFEITLRTGFPKAAMGDLCTVAYPMSDTQVFTAVVNVR